MKQRAAAARPDIEKQRDILFAKFPPGQVAEAAGQLAQLGRLRAEVRSGRRAVAVTYILTDHTLRELEDYLIDRGFHLDNTLFAKLMRGLINYSEDVQLRNMQAPERLTKRSDDAYVRSWERHQHGDHDDTPPEWREYQ